MGVATMTCTIDGAPLRRVREVLDAIDPVVVVFLVCTVCGREYLDTEKPKRKTVYEQQPKLWEDE
ncbi:MAG TPA: hypothetical protein VMR92_08535 [Gemmatimonadales bacterium]|nr:hypothetical protein [Gemmatimonadales bacterium]